MFRTLARRLPFYSSSLRPCTALSRYESEIWENGRNKNAEMFVIRRQNYKNFLHRPKPWNLSDYLTIVLIFVLIGYFRYLPDLLDYTRAQAQRATISDPADLAETQVEEGKKKKKEKIGFRDRKVDEA